MYKQKNTAGFIVLTPNVFFKSPPWLVPWLVTFQASALEVGPFDSSTSKGRRVGKEEHTSIFEKQKVFVFQTLTVKVEN